MGKGANPAVNRWRWWGLALVIFFSLALLFWWATHWGIGIGYDSYFYLTAAENLRFGHGLGRFSAEGYWSPLTHYPPLYPIVLSLLSSLAAIDASAAARALNAFLLGANGLIFAALAAWGSDRRALGLLAGGFFLLTPFLLEQHLWAMSEALFFLLMQGFVYSLSRYQIESRSIRWLIAAGVLGALAYLTRYAALALLGAGMLIVLARRRDPWCKRILHASLFSAILGLITVPWLLRNAALTGSLTNRNLRFHSLNLDQIKQAGRTLADWIVPESIPLEIRAALVVLAIAVILVYVGKLVIGSIRASTSPEPRAALQTSWFSIVSLYPLALIFSLTFFDASTRLNDRILSPFFICILALAILGPLFDLLRGNPFRRWAGAVGLMLLFLFPYSLQSSRLIAASHQRGFGFNNRSWRQSATVHAVEMLPSDALIYSNEAFPLSYRTGRDVFLVPERLDPVLASVREGYRQQLGTMRNRLADSRGYLVIFHPDRLRVELAPLADLTEGMELFNTYPDGRIYHPFSQ